MNDWKPSILQFLDEFRKENKIIGVLACGSYITGQPSKRSDIDLHLILPDTVDYRERGDIYRNGFLIEYFANPPKQILNYFSDDHKNNRAMAITQFITGDIIFEENNVITDLKQKAKEYLNTPFLQEDLSKKEISKYAIWDTLDNLQDAAENNAPDFKFMFGHALYEFYETYAKYLRLQVVFPEKLFNYFSDESMRNKYLLDEFPDLEFAKIFKKVLMSEGNNEMMVMAKVIVDHIHGKMGGFQIDGWKIRTKLPTV